MSVYLEFLPLPDFYYEGRRKEFDQNAYTDWFNDLSRVKRAWVLYQRANSIMRKHAENTQTHVEKYLKRIYSFDEVFTEQWEGCK